MELTFVMFVFFKNLMDGTQGWSVEYVFVFHQPRERERENISLSSRTAGLVHVDLRAVGNPRGTPQTHVVTSVRLSAKELGVKPQRILGDLAAKVWDKIARILTSVSIMSRDTQLQSTMPVSMTTPVSFYFKH